MPKIDKILTPDNFLSFKKKTKNKSIVLCHGVFDLVHIGHINHFEAAKSHGDILIVSITSDKYVNKRPEGPFFDEKKRLDYLTHIEIIDYVIKSKNLSSIEIIDKIKPNFYAKGIEYKNPKNDTHKNLKKEIKALNKIGGKIIYTDDEVASSSFIFNNLKKDLNKKWYLNAKKLININYLKKTADRIKKLKICVIGENISDIYIHSSPLGRSSKNSSLVVKVGKEEIIPGGTEALANNIDSYSDYVTLLTQEIEKNNLKQNYKQKIFKIGNIIKKTRIIDNHTQVNLLQTYNNYNLEWDEKNFNKLKSFLKTKNFDIIACIDFGHGFFTPKVIDLITNLNTYLSLNVQTNAGNRGYNFVNKWKRSDYLTITDEELKLSIQDKNLSHLNLLKKLKKYHSYKTVNITLGSKGSIIFKNSKNKFTPAFVTKGENIVDRVGAGDSLFGSTLGLAYLDTPLEVIGAVGNIAGALNLSFRANKTKITYENIIKNLTYLLK